MQTAETVSAGPLAMTPALETHHKDEAMVHEESTVAVADFSAAGDWLNWRTKSSVVGAALRKMAEYLVLHDADPVIAAWACAVSAADPDDKPLWLMLVGPPSGSKTEIIDTLNGVRNDQFSTITEAGLLAQSRRKGSQPTGLLARHQGDRDIFVTISDMAVMLARGSGGGGGRSGAATASVFDALRLIYDGHYKRELAEVSPEWEGRLTLLAASTSKIDDYSAHADALGPRWVYMRLRQQDDEQRQATVEKVRDREAVDPARAEVSAAVAALVRAARKTLARGEVHLSTAVTDAVETSVQLASYGRVTVPRDNRGEVVGMAEWEEPARLAVQLTKLARALTAMDVGDDATVRIVRRAALSCVPPARVAVVRYLADLPVDDARSTNQVRNDVGLSWQTAKNALGDWEAAGVLEESVDERAYVVPDEEHAPRDRRPHLWRVAPAKRALVQAGLL